MFTRVFAVGNAEAELEVEALEQLFPEIMPLNHPEFVDGFVTHGELHSIKNKPSIFGQ